MDEARITELRALADAATPGPWAVNNRQDLDWLSKSERVDSRDHQPGSSVHSPANPGAHIAATGWPHRNAREDAAFIAASRQAVPDLIAALRDAWAELDLANEQLRAEEMHAEGKVCDVCTHLEWEQMEKRCAVLRAERDALAAQVERARALADEWDQRGYYGVQNGDELRAALDGGQN